MRCGPRTRTSAENLPLLDDVDAEEAPEPTLRRQEWPPPVALTPVRPHEGSVSAALPLAPIEDDGDVGEVLECPAKVGIEIALAGMDDDERATQVRRGLAVNPLGAGGADPVGDRGAGERGLEAHEDPAPAADTEHGHAPWG